MNFEQKILRIAMILKELDDEETVDDLLRQMEEARVECVKAQTEAIREVFQDIRNMKKKDLIGE